MTATTTDARIVTRLAELTKQRAERKDELDLPLAMTRRQANEYVAETAALDAKIHAIHTAVATLATLDIATDTKWRDFLITARATLIAELGTLPSPLRERSAQDKAADLSWSVKLIDFGLGIAKLGIVSLASTRIGQLMAAAGYAVEGASLRGPNGWRGSLPEVEQRVKDLARQRASAAAALDAALRTDAEIEQREAEAMAHSAILNSMTIRLGADGRLVAYTADDDVLPLDSMTPEQRKAFKRFESVSG